MPRSEISLRCMITVAEKVVAAFDSLSAEEQQAVAKAILRRLAPFESGPLDDNEVALAGDQIAAMLEVEEGDATTR